MCSTITIRKGWVRFSSLTLLWYFDLFGSLSNLYWSHMPHWWAIIHTDIYFHFKVGSFWAGVAIKAIRTLFPALLLCIVLYICIFFNFCKARFCDMETVRKEYFTDSTLPQDFLDWRSLLLHLVIIMMKGWVLMHSKEEIIAEEFFVAFQRQNLRLFLWICRDSSLSPSHICAIWDQTILIIMPFISMKVRRYYPCGKQDQFPIQSEEISQIISFIYWNVLQSFYSIMASRSALPSFARSPSHFKVKVLLLF